MPASITATVGGASSNSYLSIAAALHPVHALPIPGNNQQ